MRRRGEQEGAGTIAVTEESAFGIAVLARRRAPLASIKHGTGDRAQRSRGTPGVPMVQATDLRDGNNFALRRRFPCADHVLGHGPFRDIVPQQEQFRQDSWRAPGRVLAGHAANQITEVAFDGGASGFLGLRLPSPVELESLSVPLDDRFGLDDGQHRSPVGPEPGKPDPEAPVAGPQLGAFDGVLVDGKGLRTVMASV